MKTFHVSYTILDTIEAESLEEAEIIAGENIRDKFEMESCYVNDIEVSEVVKILYSEDIWPE